jgi:heme A synthase
VLLALQGAVGLDQYETHLPTELVWLHVGLACGTWLTVLWAACAAGRLETHESRISADRRLDGHLGARAPVKFPGN